MKYKLNIGQTSCLLVAILIVIFLGYILGSKVFQYIQPRWFPKQEDLNITKWSTYTEYWGEKPLFTIQYPKGWSVKKTGSGGSGPHTEIRSPWNIKNNKEGNFILIDIHWDSEKGWGGRGDPVIGSNLNNIKISMTDENFTKSKIDSYEALFAKDGILDKDNIYIYTDSNFPFSDIFRFELYCHSETNFQQAKSIYYKIANSFNYLE